MLTARCPRSPDFLPPQSPPQFLLDHSQTTQKEDEKKKAQRESEEGRRTEEEGAASAVMVAENTTSCVLAHTSHVTARCPRFAFLPLTTTTTISSRSLTNHTEGGAEEEGTLLLPRRIVDYLCAMLIRKFLRSSFLLASKEKQREGGERERLRKQGKMRSIKRCAARLWCVKFSSHLLRACSLFAGCRQNEEERKKKEEEKKERLRKKKGRRRSKAEGMCLHDAWRRRGFCA